MATARIFGYSTSVSREDSEPEKGRMEVTYHITGEGTQEIYNQLTNLKVDSLKFKNGRLSVTRTALTNVFMDMPYLISLEKILDKATTPEGSSSASSPNGLGAFGLY